MRTNTGVRASLLLLVTLLSKVALSMKLFSFDLENYNGWNLPFAKTISATIDIAPFQGHSSQEFVVDMDASAMFSVLFTTLDITTASKINYTMSSMDSLELEGCWANVTYDIVGRQLYESNNDTETTMTFTFATFIAKSEKINGLDGTIGLAPVMMKNELRNYNFLYSLMTAYDVNLEALYYNLDIAADNLFFGTLDLYNNTMDILDSDNAVYKRLDNLNVINLNKLVSSYMSSDLLTSFGNNAPSDSANPFFQYQLIELAIEGWYIGGTRMLNAPGHYPSFVNISTTLSGMMVQQNFYREFNEAFISVLCSNDTDLGLDDHKVSSGKQLSVSNWQCGCGGGGITGMPSIFMDMGSPTGGLISPGKKVSYALGQQIFTQFPKVMYGTRGE